jgi:hypothetical protein
MSIAGLREVTTTQRNTMSTILLIILILLLVGALPVYPHSKNWGYAPAGGLGTVLIILLLLYFFGAI